MAIIIITKRKVIIKEPEVEKPRETKPLDAMAHNLIKEWPNLLVPWYLMASWMYYARDLSLVTDGFYDELCKTLDLYWDDVEHAHKHVVDRASVAAGTGYGVTTDRCPLTTRAAASALARVQWGVGVAIND